MGIREVAMLATIYLALSGGLFLIGWYEPYVSIPLIIGGAVMIYRAFKINQEWKSAEEEKWSIRVVDIVQLIALFILTCLCLYGTGMAGGVRTHPDFVYFRNACYHNLIDAPWPVVLPNGKEMTYYIRFRLCYRACSAIWKLASGACLSGLLSPYFWPYYCCKSG